MDYQTFNTVNQISAMLDTNPDDWRNYVTLARNVMASMHTLAPSADPTERQRQNWHIDVFQRLAYSDVDNGGVADIASWCVRQALTLLQHQPEDVDLLRLVGQNWLLRAQPCLARIHLLDGHSSSSGGSHGATASAFSLSRSEEERQAARAAAEAEDRLHTADYVEASGILLPAVEYLARAVEVAQSQERLTGNLLATAAEGYMSLGNVSSMRINDRYFHQALAYLRLAENLPDYTLPTHLQQYLADYGPYDLLNEE